MDAIRINGLKEMRVEIQVILSISYGRSDISVILNNYMHKWYKNYGYD